MTTVLPEPWEAFFKQADHLNRLLVTGAPGAGKTTIARDIAAGLDLPFISDDHHVMLRNWAIRPEVEQIRLRRAAVSQPRWLLDGVDIAMTGAVVSHVEHVIWIDLPLWLRLWRVVRRTGAQWGRTRSEHPDGNPERFDLRKLRFLIGMILRAAPARRRIARRIERHALPCVWLTSAAEVDRFMDQLRNRLAG